MSLRLEMLQVARLAPKLLRDSADLVRDFTLSQLNDDGGFKNRSGASDLYYTVFGVENLMALRADLPAGRIGKFLETFGTGQNLDFVHLACLARCRANVGWTDTDPNTRTGLIRRIESHRSNDGGYHNQRGNESGTIYAAFLAMGAYQDADLPFTDPGRLISFVESMRTDDGGYANERGMKIGTTPAAAAAVTILRNLRAQVPPDAGRWILAQCRAEGGFLAMPRAPMPDLLSTAVALHALAGLEIPLDPVKESCLDYLDSLWTNRGAFHGNWADDALDCEYTYYGLLALGHLSL